MSVTVLPSAFLIESALVLKSPQPLQPYSIGAQSGEKSCASVLYSLVSGLNDAQRGRNERASSPSVFAILSP